jgi:hypothetical protein
MKKNIAYILIALSFLVLSPAKAYPPPTPTSNINLASASFPITQCLTIRTAAASDDYPALFRFAYAVTIRAWHCLQAGATNVIGGMDNCDANGANCNAVSTDLTCTATEADNSTLNSYASLAAGRYLGWHVTSVSGTNTWLTICFDYTID